MVFPLLTLWGYRCPAERHVLVMDDNTVFSTPWSLLPSSSHLKSLSTRRVSGLEAATKDRYHCVYRSVHAIGPLPWTSVLYKQGVFHYTWWGPQLEFRGILCSYIESACLIPSYDLCWKLNGGSMRSQPSHSTHWGRLFPDDILKCIFLNQNVWISITITLKFVPRCPINDF